MATPPEAPPWTAPPSTAGAESCADCHEDLVQSWSLTGMARALGPVFPHEFQGLRGAADAPAGYHYAFELPTRAADTPKLVETRHAAPGHRLEYELAFAIGAGELDRSYAAVDGAFLWFAPLEVLSAGGGRHAALSPGLTIAPGSRLGTPITPECLGCHTDAPPPATFPMNLRPDPSEWQPRGISCAGCHGATEPHARWQERDLAGAAPPGPDPLLRLDELGRVESVSVCAACHLQGDARIVLTGSEFGPPAPGGDVLLQRAVFVAAHPGQDVGFVSHVERLALSTCFRESRMTCTTCHDPHRSLHAEPERARVRDACAECHAGGGGEPRLRHRTAAAARACSDPRATEPDAADCAGCHMRKTPVFDVAEVLVHDHWIRRAPGPPSQAGPLRTDEAPDGDWSRFAWPDQPPPAHADDAGLRLMALTHRGHLEQAARLIDTAPGPAADAHPMYHHVRGSLLERRGRESEARAAYERALELDPAGTASAVNLGLLLGRLGEPQRGLELLSEHLARHPAAEGALRNRSVLLHQVGAEAAALKDLEAAFGLLPRADLAEVLGRAASRNGDPAAALRWRELAGRLDPVRFPP